MITIRWAEIQRWEPLLVPGVSFTNCDSNGNYHERSLTSYSPGLIDGFIYVEQLVQVGPFVLEHLLWYI